MMVDEVSYRGNALSMSLRDVLAQFKKDIANCNDSAALLDFHDQCQLTGIQPLAELARQRRIELVAPDVAREFGCDAQVFTEFIKQIKFELAPYYDDNLGTCHRFTCPALPVLRIPRTDSVTHEDPFDSYTEWPVNDVSKVTLLSEAAKPTVDQLLSDLAMHELLPPLLAESDITSASSLYLIESDDYFDAAGAVKSLN